MPRPVGSIAPIRWIGIVIAKVVPAINAGHNHGSKTNDMKTNPRKRGFIAGSISCFPIGAQGYSVALQIDPEWSGHHKCRRDDIVQFQK